MRDLLSRIFKANKYKLYNSLRAGDKTALSTIAVSTQKPSPKKRHGREPPQPPAAVETPQKRAKCLPAAQDAGLVSAQALNSPENTPIAHRKSIGPTPQKNGRVLGLFDLLTPSSTFRTPSKRQSLAPLPTNVIGTPSRTKPSKEPDQEERPRSSVKRRSRSPPSSSKRTYLASFLTPSNRRVVDIGTTPDAAASVSKLRFDDTPMFLRRDSQRFSQNQNHNEAEDADAADASSWSPVAVRVVRPKPAGRGLSALVKGLREMEEAKLDDDLEMLREMEGGGGDAPESHPKPLSNIHVHDSQVPDMPLGPDGQGGSESEDPEAQEAEGKDRNGRPLRIWKKKGQKRTTRRVTIKPNTAKWKPEPEWKGGREDDDGEEEIVRVEETQFGITAQTPGAVSDAEALQTDDDFVSECSSDDGKPQTQESAEDAKKQRGEPKQVHEKPPQEKKRKVSATAHANFRALKIKKKNSKGKGRGRFGRRR